MRQYMECLVSKAIATCPQILCVDTSKFFWCGLHWTTLQTDNVTVHSLPDKQHITNTSSSFTLSQADSRTYISTDTHRH